MTTRFDPSRLWNPFSARGAYPRPAGTVSLAAHDRLSTAAAPAALHWPAEHLSGAAAPPLALEILPDCFAKLYAYTQAAPGEIAGFGTVRKGPGPYSFVLEDIFICPQTATLASADIEAEALSDFLLDFTTRGGDVNRLRCWWHSHGDMAPFFSGTDRQTLDGALTAAPWMLALVVNKAGEMQAALRVNDPCPMWLEPVAAGMHIAPGLWQTAEAEVAAQVRSGHSRAPVGRQVSQASLRQTKAEPTWRPYLPWQTPSFRRMG